MRLGSFADRYEGRDGVPSEAAFAASKSYKEDHGLGKGQVVRPKAWYFNKTSHSTTQKDVSRTKTGTDSNGVESPFLGPFPTREAAAEAGMKAVPGYKSKFAQGKGYAPRKDGKPRKVPDLENRLWVRAGAVLADGDRHWIVVGSTTYGKLVGAKALIDGVPVDQLRQFTSAERRAETKAKSSAARPTSGKSKDERKAEASERLARVRQDNKNVRYSLCIENPGATGIIGIRRTDNGKTTNNARRIASETGLVGAATRRDGQYVVSDQQVISHIEAQIRAKRLTATTRGNMCVV